MTILQFYEYKDKIQKAVERDIHNDKLLAIGSAVFGVVLTLWLGPEAGIFGGSLSAIMVARYFVFRNRVPYFVRGLVLRKWEEVKTARNLTNYYYYAEVDKPVNIQKNKKEEIVEQKLPTNITAEIFHKGFPVAKEGGEILLCFSGGGVYLGFIAEGQFVSYWD
jgi:hypothetical protein